MKNKNKKHFAQKRFVYFAEVPQFSEGELEGLKKAKGEETEELNVANLVAAVNGEVNKHAAQLAELPKEYNTLLHNEIKGYLERSTGRYEKDAVKGLSAAEFKNYVEGMRAKVETMMADWAPTEEDIKKKKEAEAKQKEAKKQAEKVMPKEEREKILNVDPSSIESMEGLGSAFDAYDQANSQMQQEAIKVFKPVEDFHKSYQEYKKARGGLESYKQFSAYLMPENDTERIDLQTKLATVKSTVTDAKDKFSKEKTRISEYGDKLGNVSNSLKEKKLAERDARLKDLDDKSAEAEKKHAAQHEKYTQLEQMQLKLFGQMKNLGEYKDKVQEAQDKQNKKVLQGEEGKQRLTQFKLNTEASLAAVNEALQNPNISDEKKKQLEETKKQLEDSSKSADTGLQSMGATLEETQANVRKLSEGENKTAVQTLNVQSHLNSQVDPMLKNLNASILGLEEDKMKYSTDKEELTKYYDGVIERFDTADEGIDSAILKNNVANNQLEKQLENLSKSLDKVDLTPPKGLSGAFEATVGVVARTVGGAVSTVGGWLSSAGKWMADQGKWLSKQLSNNKEGMNPVLHSVLWGGVQAVNFAVGTASGLTEMAGGLLTLGGNLIGHPIDTVAGLGSMIGYDATTGDWNLKTAGHTWKEIGKSIISYEDFSNGEVGLGLGKIFPNVVITIETLGSAPGAKVVAQMGAEARVAFAAARAEGASVLRATATGAKTFVLEGSMAMAQAVKELPAAMKSFFVGGTEGEANLLARMAEKYKSFSKITVGEAVTGVGEAFSALGKGAASKLETYWGGTKFESYRLGKMAGEQLALVEELGKSAGKFQEYEKTLAKIKQEVKAGNAALTEEEINAIAKYRLSQTNRELSLAGTQHEQMLGDFAKSQQAFEKQVIQGLSDENKGKTGKLLEDRNAAQKGMMDTGQSFNDFKKLLDAKDPKAMEAARQFQEALLTRDPKMIKAWKDANWSKLPPEWRGAFQNMEYRLQYAGATQDIAMVKSADQLEKGIAALPNNNPETIAKFIEDYNKKNPGVATGEPRILYKLPEGKGAIVIGPDGRAVYLERSALETHFKSVFSEDIPAAMKAEGKNAKNVAGWIDEKGQIHYSSGYFEEKYGVKMAQREGKNVFLVDGKEMSPMEFFRTEKGKEVMQAMKGVKDHEVTHRLLEATDKASGGKLGAQWQKMIKDNPDLLTAFARRGEALTARTAQEFMCEVADGRIKLSPGAMAELEETLGGSIKGFSFDKVRQIDTAALKFSSPGALERSFEDAFTALDAHAILSDRLYKNAYEIALARYPEIFKATGPELQRLLESGTQNQRMALAYNKAMIGKKWMAADEEMVTVSTQKMISAQDAYSKFAATRPELTEEIWNSYRAAMKGTKEDIAAVRKMYPVTDQAVFDYIEANLRLHGAERKIRMNTLRERLEKDIIDQNLAGKTPDQIQAYIEKVNGSLEAFAPGDRTSLVHLPKDKGIIYVTKEGKLEYRAGKAAKAGEAEVFADFDAEIGQMLDKQIAAEKLFVDSFTQKYPVSPKLKKAIEEGKISPVKLRDIDDLAKTVSAPRATALTELLLENPEVGAKVLSTLKKAGKGVLTEDHLDALVMGAVDGEKLGLLEGNIANPQLTKDYVEKIINASPEVLDGGKMKYFEGAAVGEGGIARFFKIAYYEPPSNKIRFAGCKKVLDQNVGFVTLDKEAEAAQRILGLKAEGLSTEHIINPQYVSADKTVIFYDIAEYSEGGIMKQNDLGKLAENAATPPEQIFKLVLDNAEGLAQLHAKGLYHLDIKPGNVAMGQNGGVLIDLGSVSKADEFVAGMQNGIPARTIEIGGQDIWVGKIPAGIGVTPGFYNEPIAQAIAAGNLPMWKLDAYALGMEIREMSTGKMLYEKGRLRPEGQIEMQTGPAHEFANAAKNRELMKLSKELLDPANTTTTPAIAAQRLKTILAMP